MSGGCTAQSVKVIGTCAYECMYIQGDSLTTLQTFKDDGGGQMYQSEVRVAVPQTNESKIISENRSDTSDMYR